MVTLCTFSTGFGGRVVKLPFRKTHHPFCLTDLNHLMLAMFYQTKTDKQNIKTHNDMQEPLISGEDTDGKKAIASTFFFAHSLKMWRNAYLGIFLWFSGLISLSDFISI